MTEQEILELTIEKKAYEEVIKQFSKGCDPRMECGLNEFLCGIEDKIREIDEKLRLTTSYDPYVSATRDMARPVVK